MIGKNEDLLDEIASGFGFFGGELQSVLLDNMKLAVVRIMPDGLRLARGGMQPLHQPIRVLGPPPPAERGSDLGNVEAMVKLVRRSYLAREPTAESLAALNLTMGPWKSKRGWGAI